MGFESRELEPRQDRLIVSMGFLGGEGRYLRLSVSSIITDLRLMCGVFGSSRDPIYSFGCGYGLLIRSHCRGEYNVDP